MSKITASVARFFVLALVTAGLPWTGRGYGLDALYIAGTPLVNTGAGTVTLTFSDGPGFSWTGPALPWIQQLNLSGSYEVGTGLGYENFDAGEWANLYAPGPPPAPTSSVSWQATGVGPGWTVNDSGFITNSYDGGNGFISPGSRLYIHINAGPQPTPTPTPSPPPNADTPNDPTVGGGGKDGGDENGPGGGGDDGGCTHGMARYTADLLTASLRITDTPLEYTPPVGARIDFIVAYHQRDEDQSPTQQYSNLGPNWTYNWISYVTDDPTNASADVSIYVRAGGTEVYSGFNSSSQSYTPDPQSQAVLVRTSGTSYEKRFRDGTKQVFEQTNGATTYPRLVLMTQVVDAFGNAVRIHYDGSHRIDRITDALSQVTTFAYNLPGDSNKITQVTDPFGRSAVFGYTNGQLTSTTDPVGISSQFIYQPGTNFINSLTTPYGTATFEAGESGTNRWLNMTDPTGVGVERIEYRDGAPGISASDAIATVPTGFGNANAHLDLRNSFYWDKKALLLYPPANGVYDYTKAKITHWLLSSDGTAPVPTAASEKMALENRVWYAYPNQPDAIRTGPTAQPSTIARVLDDGTTQTYQFEYNDLGNVTKTIDPIGRTFTNVYADNHVDLLEKRQTRDGSNELIQSFGGYSNHLPGTSTDAAGQTTIYTYNARGQVTNVQDAKGEITVYSYGGAVPDGYLASVTGPQFVDSSPVTSYSYDGAHRVHTTTGSDGYTVTTDYDNLDRLAKITYPDGTYQQILYTEYTDHDTGVMTLDATQIRDRLGRFTYKHYNSNKQLEKVTDPLGQITLYDWCTCGALTGITDPNGNITTFDRDLQSRVRSKVFVADGSAISYAYENTTSRLQSSMDAKSQRINYLYFGDDTVKQVSYTNLMGQPLIPATPAVSYTYDQNYNRVLTMTDGIGVTNYDYYTIDPSPVRGAGQLKSVDGPLLGTTDKIVYTYDELGRVLTQSINGVPSTVVYDSLGRVSTSDNALGHFSRTYDLDITQRLKRLTYPNGQSANYHYFGNENDRRLQNLQHLTGGAVNLSKFDYTYDAEGQIVTWNKTLSSTETDLALTYDDARQLKKVSQGRTHRDYEYDAAGNRLVDSFSAQHIHGGNFYTANNLNQLDGVTRDPGVGAAQGPFPITYDANGNMASDGGNQTFEWDAANRLVAINYIDSSTRTEFAYDGLNRRVKITEKGSGVTALVQPEDSSYATFSTAPFNLPSGSYTITFEGLDPAGGDNTAFVDAVTLNDAPVTNGSFEDPPVSNYKYPPIVSNDWSYQNDAGIVANGSDFGNVGAPVGTQAAFVQIHGIVSQTLSVDEGTYTLGFQAAQRGGNVQQMRVTVLPYPPNTVVKTFVWCGNTICEERDATGSTVTKRFFAEGEQRVGGSDAGNYYYSRDHLGSVREVTDSTGALKAQYDYDAWGNEVVVSGNMNVDFGFTGHYFHQPSGLNLSMYRAYNPSLGRWISRDPSGENSGINLYGYVGNNPTNLIDPLGLYTLDQAAAQQIGQYIQDTQRAIRIIDYLHRNSDFIGWADYQTAIRSAGFQDAGIAIIGSTDSSTRATAISEAINDVERSPLLIAGRLGSTIGGVFSDALYEAVSFGSLNPNSGMYYYTLGELAAEKQLLENLLNLQSDLVDGGFLPNPKCP